MQGVSVELLPWYHKYTELSITSVHRQPVPCYTQLSDALPQPTRVDLCARWLYFLRRHQCTLYRPSQALAGRVVDLDNSQYTPRKHWGFAGTSTPPSPRLETRSGSMCTAPQ